MTKKRDTEKKNLEDFRMGISLEHEEVNMDDRLL